MTPHAMEDPHPPRAIGKDDVTVPVEVLDKRFSVFLLEGLVLLDGLDPGPLSLARDPRIDPTVLWAMAPLPLLLPSQGLPTQANRLKT